MNIEQAGSKPALARACIGIRMTSLRVLTLNVWGIHYLAVKIRERLGYIVEELKTYDIVALQEVWSRGDFSFLVSKLEHTLPYSHRFCCGPLGSGLCVFSRHPISTAFTHRFSNSGAMNELADGEICVGKGIMGCRIITPCGQISVYNLHCNPRCRDSQLFEVFQFVEQTRGSDIVFVMGDFNTKPKHAAYSLMTKCLCLQDVFEQDPVDTCDLASNIFTLKGMTPKRIDFILYSDETATRHTLKLKSRKLALSGHIPKKDFPWSDHEGVEAIFLMEERKACVDLPERIYDDTAVQVFLQVADNIRNRRLRYQTTPRRVISGWVLLALFSFLSCVLLSSLSLHTALASVYLYWLPVFIMGVIGAVSVLLVFTGFITAQVGQALEANLLEIQALLKFNTLRRELSTLSTSLSLNSSSTTEPDGADDA